MPWGRAILAVLVCGLVLGGIAFIAMQVGGAAQPSLPSAPGLNEADRAALEAPYQLAAAGRDDELAALLSAEVDPAAARAQIDAVQALLPPAASVTPRLMRWNVSAGTGGQSLSAAHEYVYPNHVVVAETVLERGQGAEPWRVYGFHVNVATPAELAVNRFTLADKPPTFIAIVAASVIVPLFCLGSFLAALFWKDLKRRWLWLIVTALGFGALALNTATGQTAFNPLSFQLFGAGATWSGSMFEAWVFSVAIPFGALAFWLTRLFAKRESAEAEAA